MKTKTKDAEKLRSATFEPLDEKWFIQAGVTPEARKHLLNSMSSLEQGRAPTPCFKLYGKSDWSLVTDFFDSIKGKVEVPQWMLDYEMSRKSKFAPQGGYKSWETLGPLFNLYQERYQDVNFDMIKQYDLEDKFQAFICMYKLVGPLQMLSAEATLSSLLADDKIETRAAGCPDFNLKKTDKQAQKNAVKACNLLIWLKYWGYVFSRYNKDKPRIFVPMPFSTMIAQARWYQPFLKRIQELCYTIGVTDELAQFWSDKIGFWNQLRIINDILDYDSYLGHDFDNPNGCFIFVQRDFEKMDTTTGPSQISDVFVPCVAKAFNYKKGSKPYNMMEQCMRSITDLPIASPSGMMVGYHGTASGGEITNGGETVNNHAYDKMASWLMYKMNQKRSKQIPYLNVFSGGNGDDGFSIYWLDDKSLMDDFHKLRAEAYEISAKIFGFRAQPSKDLFSTEYGIYCQNMYWMDSSPVDYPTLKKSKYALHLYYNDKKMHKNYLHMAYPASLIINSIVNPEHQYTPSQWDRDYRDIDIVGKLNNAFGLPYFEQLVDYVDNGLKYPLLGSSQPETERILSKYDKYRSLQSLGERYNRDQFDFVTSPVFQYILKKRGYQIDTDKFINKIKRP